MFNKNSGLVQLWVRLIETGDKIIDDVPVLSNLKEIVQEVISNGTKND